MHIWKAAVAGAIAVPLLFAAACGGGDDDSNESPSPSADSQPTVNAPDPASQSEAAQSTCDLLSSEELAEAVGGPTDPVQTSSIGENFEQCLYRIQGGGDLDSAVVVQVRSDTSSSEFEDLVRENAPEELGEVRTVDGLGDAAYEQSATFVLAGDEMVVVTVVNNDPDGGTARQQDLARKAIARLP